MKIVIANKVEIREAPEPISNQLINTFTIENPKYKEAVRQGRWTGNIDKVITLYERKNSTLIIPRGYLPLFLSHCERDGLEYQLEDKRRLLTKVDFQFSVKPAQCSATAVP